MKKYREQSEFNEELEKPSDWLPDGSDDKNYVQEDKEWPRLERRLGSPKIFERLYFSEVLDWIKKEFQDSPDDFSYFEAGCGHGNDIRAIKKELKNKGRFLGVDMSKAEMLHGLDFYYKRDGENTEEAKKLFAQGDLRDLKHANIWDEGKKDFSKPTEIKDNQFDLVYTTNVLQGLGYGYKTYHKKKESAQQMLKQRLFHKRKQI